MRTTYYPFIDESTPEGSKTLADSAQDQIDFGVGISSSIGIGTLPRVGAQLAIHFDGSEDNRTGGFEINANSNSSGDKHGARILAYNRLTKNKGFRRLRFQASEYSIETPDAGISTTNSGPTLNITGFGSVGIGTTDPLAQLDVRGDVRFNNKLYDKDGDSGTSGQVLSSTGTQVDWVNVGTLSAGTASQVAVTASNDNQDFNVTFVDSSSGNQSIKADTNTNFLYNPSLNRLELNTFNGTGLMLSGSGSEYVGMQLKTSDSSATLTRNIFIDTVNELGNAIANQVGSVQSDGGSHWRWETQPPGDRTDRRVERLRITGLGSVGIGSDNPVTKLDVFGNIKLSDTDPEIQLNTGGPRFRVPEDNTLTIHSGGNSGSETLERVRITSLGNVGIGTTNTIDFFDGGFDRRLVVYGGGAQVGSAYTWTGGDFYHAEDIITAVTKTKSGGFAINCREQEVAGNDPSRPIWTLRSYTNEPIAFGQGLTEIARFNEDGNLGIGTTTSTSPLTLFKQDPQYVGVTTVLTLKTYRSDMTVNNPAGGSIKFDNYDGNHGHEAFIEVIAPNSHSSGEAAREETADFNFKQTNNGTLNTRFTIKGETGRIGIGIINPTQKLDVSGGIRAFTDADNLILLNSSDGSIELKRTGGPFIDFADSGGEDHDCRIKQEDNGLAFTTGGNGSANEKLLITASGITSIRGADDQDNLKVTVNNNTEFAVHQDDTDGEVSLRAQDPSGSNNSKYMTFFTQKQGDAATERLRLGTSGQIGLSGANYGTSGQILTSNGSSSAPSWQSLISYGEMLQSDFEIRERNDGTALGGHSGNRAHWVKIGNNVRLYGYITTAAGTSTNTNIAALAFNNSDLPAISSTATTSQPFFRLAGTIEFNKQGTYSNVVGAYAKLQSTTYYEFYLFLEVRNTSNENLNTTYNVVKVQDIDTCQFGFDLWYECTV